MTAVSNPVMLVMSAPSGAGKTTLRDRLVAEFPSLIYSVSCTTRPPRAGERDGHDYVFLSPDDFERRVARGEFLEHATVHGHRYGTRREPVVAALRSGRDVLMDIDVVGAARVRAAARAAPSDDPIRRGYLDVFIAPPSLEELRRRLVARGTDTPEAIAKRLDRARQEMERAGEFMRHVVNDDLERAYAELRALFVRAKGGEAGL